MNELRLFMKIMKLLILIISLSASSGLVQARLTGDYERDVLDYMKMIRDEQSRMHNVPEVDGRFLRAAVHLGNAGRGLELGTSNGYSAVWFGLGLKQTGGSLVTVEIDLNRWWLAEENFKEVGLDKVT